MPQIDFYILSSDDPQARFLTACRLADKGYQSGEKIYIHCDSRAHAQMLDDLLWTFRDGSFIPHAMYPTAGSDRSPVLIGSGDDYAQGSAVLINVATGIPAFFADFKRVLEIIDGDTERRQQGRQRYRRYKESGFTPNDHKL